MAKLYFKYGTMDASKSADLLMTVHKYLQQNKNIICLCSDLNTRSDVNYIESRALSYKYECSTFKESANIYDLIKAEIDNKAKKVNCILIDEAQFLKKEQVFQLTQIVDILNIPVLCYGLKNSYIKGQLFEGSNALLYFADSIQEIKSVCHFCDSKATMNLRIKNNIPINYEEIGDTIVIGDVNQSEDYFITTCRKHYFNPEMKNI